MSTEHKDNGTWYLRMFSYLLVICGAFGLATGGAVIYRAFADGGAPETSLSLGAVALGLSSVIAYGITVAAGITGRRADRQPSRFASLYTVALAGIAATVIGLGLCYATGVGMPTALLFNGLLMVICAVIAANLRKTAP